MKYLVLAVVFAAGYLASQLIGGTTAADPQPAKPPVANDPLANPSIDFAAHIVAAQNAQTHRATRRLSEDDFLKASKEQGVVILDARSKAMYDLLHIEGAINVNFSDLDVETLKKTLPDKTTKILIYCNNNFTPAPDAPGVGQRPNQPANPMAAKAVEAFKGKGKALSLNISTYTTLYGYGYTNVYELAPLLDPTKTKLALVSSNK